MSVQSLNPFRTTLAAYRFVWADRRTMIRTAAAPTVILSLFAALQFAVAPPAAPDAGFMIAVSAWVVIQIVLLVALYAMFAVAWHRRYLAPDEAMTIGSSLRWDGRKTRFLIRLFGAALLSALAGVPPVILVSLFGGLFLAGSDAVNASVIAATVLGVITSLVVFGRLSLCLPAAAVGEKLRFADSWAMTRGAGAKMFFILIAPSIPISLAGGLLDGLMSQALIAGGLETTLTGVLLYQLVSLIVAYIGIAVGVTALSIAYHTIKHGAGSPLPSPEGGG
ncbi:MAG: hypothetical protein QNJ84_06845 [Alphaproteobacteria bacterium]|nr:hypothetical protein [Alphaproteobacteria bacterium]